MTDVFYVEYFLLDISLAMTHQQWRVSKMLAD